MEVKCRGEVIIHRQAGDAAGAMLLELLRVEELVNGVCAVPGLLGQSDGRQQVSRVCKEDRAVPLQPVCPLAWNKWAKSRTHTQPVLNRPAVSSCCGDLKAQQLGQGCAFTNRQCAKCVLWPYAEHHKHAAPRSHSGSTWQQGCRKVQGGVGRGRTGR